MANDDASSRRPWAMILALGCVGCVVCGGVLTYAGMRVAGSLKFDEGAQAMADAVGIDTSAETEAAETFLVVLRRGRVEDAYGMVSKGMREQVSIEQFRHLQSKIEGVMGAYRSKKLRSYDKHVSDHTHIDVVFDGTFDRGEGTITFRFVVEGTRLRVEVYRVDSPLFIDALPDKR